MQELTGQSGGYYWVGVALVRVGEDPVIAVSFTYVVATSATGPPVSIPIIRSLNDTPRFRVFSPAADVMPLSIMRTRAIMLRQFSAGEGKD